MLQQALPVEQQTASLQQIQSQAQHVNVSLDQHTRAQSQRLNSQYNPSPEKSKGNLYLLSIILYVIYKGIFNVIIYFFTCK